MLFNAHYAQNYAGIIGTSLAVVYPPVGSFELQVKQPITFGLFLPICFCSVGLMVAEPTLPPQ